ncbi:MAG: hypothetical protein F6K04_02480 [Leptolyngbya sp. SIO4C5]|nr:hypothetical protein [Leptolyngbya sp. SIO4C5]
MASNITRKLLETVSINYERVMTELLPHWDWPCQCERPGKQLRCLECPGFRILVDEMQNRLSGTPQEAFAQLPPIKRQKPYPNEIQQICIHLFKRGHTLTEIQALTGVANRKTLRAWLVAENLIDTSTRAHEIHRTRCLDLYKQGLKPAEVEDATGVPADLIAHWASQAGVARPNPTFTDEQKTVCIELYLNGLSAKSVEQQTNIPELHIKKWIKESGVRRKRIFGSGRPPTYGKEDKQKAFSLFQAGYTTQQIEEKISVGANTLLRWLKNRCLYLLDNGWTPSQIETQFGVGNRVLRQWWEKVLKDRHLT